VVALYFMLLFALANKSGAVEGSVEGVAIEEEGAESFSIQEMSSALAVSATICWTATQICAAAGITGCVSLLALHRGDQALRSLGMSLLWARRWSIPIATLITILAATAFPGQLSSLKGAGEAAGVMFMQLFFAATGASGSIRMVIATAPVPFPVSLSQVAGPARNLAVGNNLWSRIGPSLCAKHAMSGFMCHCR
jgi:hypothetical protein